MKSRGARLNVKYLRFLTRKKPKRCPVCLKALRGYNKVGLCSMDYQIEMNQNRISQGFNNVKGE